MLLWRLIKQQYDLIIRVAATKQAVLGLYIFALLESIIIPIPADPLLIATVLARPKRWRQLALGCTLASVIGGVGGWALGTFFSPYLGEWLTMLPERLAAPAAFSCEQTPALTNASVEAFPGGIRSADSYGGGIILWVRLTGLLPLECTNLVVIIRLSCTVLLTHAGLGRQYLSVRC